MSWSVRLTTKSSQAEAIMSSEDVQLVPYVIPFFTAIWLVGRIGGTLCYFHGQNLSHRRFLNAILGKWLKDT